MNFLHRSFGFYASVVVVQAFYFFMALHFGHIYNGDSFEYIQEAVNIKEHLFFYCGNLILPVKEEYMTLRPPGYPLFIAAVYYFTINNGIVLFLQNIASLISIFLARKTFMHLGYERKMDAWFLLLLLVFPGQFVYANVMAPDILLQTSSLIYFHYTILFLKNKKSGYAFYMSLALIAGLFIKPIIYPFALIHLLMILIWGIGKKIITPKLIVSSLLPLVGVVAYSYINKIRTEKFHFSSIQSVNALYNHLCYYSEKEGFEKGALFIEKEYRALEQFSTFKERYEHATARGMDLLKENFTSYMQFHLKKSALFFLQTGRGELDQFAGTLTLSTIYAGKSEMLSTIIKKKELTGFVNYAKDNPTLCLALLTLFSNAVKLFGVFLFVRHAKVVSILKWFIVLYLLYFALITGPVSNAHYMLPVSLVMMCCSLTGYLCYLKRKKRADTLVRK